MNYRWIIVGYTLVLQAVALGTLIYSFALFVIPWLQEFEADRAQVMLTMSITQVAAGLISPLVGSAMDRYPIKRFIFGGLSMLVIGFFLLSKATSLWQIQIIYGTLFPFGLTLMSTLAAQTLITRVFKENRGTALGISATGTNLGGIIFPLLISGWLVSMGWRETMELLAIIALLLIAPLTWLVLRREPLPYSSDGTDTGELVKSWSTSNILSNSAFWIPTICLVTLNLGFGALQFNLGAFGADVGFETSQVAKLIALNGVCMIAGKFFFGAIGDHVDHRVMYWLAAALMACGMIVLQGNIDKTRLVTGIIAVGLAGGGILPMFGIIYGARFGVGSFARVMGLAMLVMMIGALGPFYAGWVYDTFGSYDFAFLTFLVLIFPAVILMRWLPTPRAQ